MCASRVAHACRITPLHLILRCVCLSIHRQEGLWPPTGRGTQNTPVFRCISWGYPDRCLAAVWLVGHRCIWWCDVRVVRSECVWCDCTLHVASHITPSDVVCHPSMARAAVSTHPQRHSEYTHISVYFMGISRPVFGGCVAGWPSVHLVVRCASGAMCGWM